MKTFMQWLEAKNIFWNGRQFSQKAALPDNYEHHICEKCGRSYPKEWIAEMGPVCQCGGPLVQGGVEDLERSHDRFSHNTRFGNVPALR